MPNSSLALCTRLSGVKPRFFSRRAPRRTQDVIARNVARYDRAATPRFHALASKKSFFASAAIALVGCPAIATILFSIVETMGIRNEIIHMQPNASRASLMARGVGTLLTGTGIVATTAVRFGMLGGQFYKIPALLVLSLGIGMLVVDKAVRVALKTYSFYCLTRSVRDDENLETLRQAIPDMSPRARVQLSVSLSRRGIVV